MSTLLQNGPRCDDRWRMALLVRPNNHCWVSCYSTSRDDYSRRCERKFLSKNEIIEVPDRPRHRVVEFRNIFIVLVRRVSQIILSSWLKTSHPIPSVRLQKVRELGQLFELIWSFHYIFIPLQFVCGLGQLFSEPLFWSSHSIHFIPLQSVRELGQLFWMPLIRSSYPHLLHPFTESTWICSMTWRPLIGSSHPILFVHLQQVRKPLN